MSESFSTSELMVAAGARELRDGMVVVAGLGIPIIAAVLAKRTHAPRLILLNEIGLADPHPIDFGMGNADPRLWYGAATMNGFIDIMGTILHRGLVDVGFLGALEVDQYGNVNSTHVRREDGGLRRFGGGGGANDLSSLAQRIIVIIRHERRKLVERVLHNTSPGFLTGGRSREQAGLRGGGPYRVLTDQAVFGFDDATRRLKLLSIHPGVSHEELRASTGFPLDIPPECPTTPAPTAEELRLIREELDPGRLYTSGL